MTRIWQIRILIGTRVWKDRMTRLRRSNFGRVCGDIWHDDKSARKYWHDKFNKRRPQLEARFRELPLSPESRVLDIGSGPGVMAIPLAERVSHVTAVEPTRGMMNVMQVLKSERGLDNLQCVFKRWDDVDIDTDLEPPYDVVIASMSLGMFDIRGAIRKMVAVCSNQIHLYWFAGNPNLGPDLSKVLAEYPSGRISSGTQGRCPFQCPVPDGNLSEYKCLFLGV